MIEQIDKYLTIAIQASIDAGFEILKVYNTAFSIELKSDNTPLTLADKNAHKVITKHLKETKLPILSEEGRSIPYYERKSWDLFWMVDPLDGTKEFVKRNGEFTVNIALIHKGISVMGVIFVPVTDKLYFGIKGKGAFCLTNVSTSKIDLRNLMTNSNRIPQENGDRKYTVVGSRSHMSPETEQLINELRLEHGDIEVLSAGSSLKICMVAEGNADIYPRFAPTMEWDTAAGQAIAEAAEKKFIDYSTGKNMMYNKENLLNNWFIVK